MSRIGKQPIEIPQGVDVTLTEGLIQVKGSKGTLELDVHPWVSVEQGDSQLVVSVQDQDNHKQRAMWGLFRKLIFNMVEGVTNGFSKQLEVVGVGYKVALSGNKLTVHAGYSHPVDFTLPAGITAQVEKNTITISGSDKHMVGEVASQIRRIRKPEPYKGKGIKYVDEQIRRKAGKSAKAA